MTGRIQREIIFICGIIGLGFTPLAFGQMGSGSQMKNWFNAFNLNKKQRDYAFSAIVFKSNVPSNAFSPGEQPELELQVQNNTGKPMDTNASIEIVHWGTRKTPGDIWHPLVSAYNTVQRIPLKVTLPPHGYHNYKINVKLPELFGGYAAIIDMGQYGRRFLTSMARVIKNDSHPVQFPLQASEIFPPSAMQRLGLQAVRLGIPFYIKSSPARAKAMEKLEKTFAEMKKHNVVATVEIGTGLDGQPMKQGRPHLDNNDVMLKTKEDLVWDPKYDEDYRQFCYDLAKKYGWPKGPINGFMLWNEPWEGKSISGWGADMLRYRTLYRIMGEAIHKAQKDAGVKVLIGGCDSSSNTFDKLFPDGKDDFLPYLDFCSIHYQGLSSPCLYRKWLERKPKRVLIWDTESWVANSEDILAAVVAADRAAGYDRSMGFFGGYVFGNYQRHRPEIAKIKTAGGIEKVTLPLIAYPMAAAVAAMQKFIGNREFKEILFKKGLPWVFVFKGLDNKPDDSTIVITGDLKGLFGDMAMYSEIRSLNEIRKKAEIEKLLPRLKKGTPEWEQMKQWLSKHISELQIKKQPEIKLSDDNLISLLTRYLNEVWPFTGVELKINAQSGKFALYDMYGNKVPPRNNQYVIPLDVQGFYLRPVAPGGAEDMLQAVKNSELNGLMSAEMIPHDFLMPVKAGARLRMTLHNITNRPLSGSLSGTLGQLSISYPKQIKLAPFEERDIMVTVTGGSANPGNQYPLKFEIKDGEKLLSEVKDTMRCNVIAHRTIAVDGKLDDWHNVIPQVIAAGSEERSLMEAAWLPFQKFEAGKADGVAAFYTAWDKDFFYIAAKIADSTTDPGTIRFATRNDDMFFYPPVSYKYDTEKTYAVEKQEEDADSTKVCGIEKPGQPGIRSGACVRPLVERMRFDLDLPVDKLTKVTLYMPWDNFRSGRAAFLQINSMSGNKLSKANLSRLKSGGFVSFDVAGKVAVEIINRRTRNKESGRLAGLFFDSETGTPDKKIAAQIRKCGGGAVYLGTDENKPGLWIGRYGKNGYMLPGLKLSKLDKGIVCRQRDDVLKQSMEWPEGVRRFSYRQRPTLPDGMSPNLDNVQIAFNAIPADQDPIMISHLPGRMPGFVVNRSTDYEFALNKVAPEYGGGTEIWRLEAPNQFRKHFYPRQPKAEWEGAVTDGKMVVNHEKGTRIVEAAIPWSEIPLVRKLQQAGKPVKFTFRINDNGGAPIEFGRGRPAAPRGGMSFHPDWRPCYANEIEFAFEK